MKKQTSKSVPANAALRASHLVGAAPKPGEFAPIWGNADGLVGVGYLDGQLVHKDGKEHHPVSLKESVRLLLIGAVAESFQRDFGVCNDWARVHWYQEVHNALRV